MHINISMNRFCWAVDCGSVFLINNESCESDSALLSYDLHGGCCMRQGFWLAFHKRDWRISRVFIELW